MPCRLRLRAIRVAPSTSLMVPPSWLIKFGREIMHRWRGRDTFRCAIQPCGSVRAIGPEPGSAMQRTSNRGRSAQHAVFLQPGLHLVPAVFGRILAVAWAIVGVEAVRCTRIDLELRGFLAFGQRRL